ncbi:MAG: hypothetical protein RL098_1806 [Bacteroidota bacterium]
MRSSSADIRKALLNQLKNGLDLNALDAKSLINTQPICINEDASVVELLQLIKNSGIVQFSNLIKAEI